MYYWNVDNIHDPIVHYFFKLMFIELPMSVAYCFRTFWTLTRFIFLFQSKHNFHRLDLWHVILRLFVSGFNISHVTYRKRSMTPFGMLILVPYFSRSLAVQDDDMPSDACEVTWNRLSSFYKGFRTVNIQYDYVDENTYRWWRARHTPLSFWNVWKYVYCTGFAILRLLPWLQKIKFTVLILQVETCTKKLILVRSITTAIFHHSFITLSYLRYYY